MGIYEGEFLKTGTIKCIICKETEHLRWCPAYKAKMPSKDTINKIIEHLKTDGRIDEDDVHYFPERFSFNSAELRNYLDTFRQDGNLIEGTYFETYNIPFDYENDYFNLIVIYGQGSAWILMTRTVAEEWIATSLKNSIEWKKQEKKDI